MRLLTAILLAAPVVGCAAPSPPQVTQAPEYLLDRRPLLRDMAAMRAKLVAHWNPDPAIFSQPDPLQYTVVVNFRLTRDGRLSAPVEVVNKGAGPLFQSSAEAAKRAVELSQPFDMLSPSNYDALKDVQVEFSPLEMCSPAAVAWLRAHPEAARAHSCAAAPRSQ